MIITWDFHKEIYFVTDCDQKGAWKLSKRKELAPLMERYGFEDSDLL